MPDEPKQQSWWQTIPGILTAIAAILTAVTGLIVVLKSGDQTKATSSATVTKSMELPKSTAPNINTGVKQLSLADDETTFLFDGRHWFTFEHSRTANAGCIRTVLDGKTHTHCVGRSIDFTEEGRTCGIIYLGTKDGALTADFALRCQGS